MSEILWNALFWGAGIAGGFACGYTFAMRKISGITRRNAEALIECLQKRGIDRPEPEAPPVEIKPRDIKRRVTLGETPDYCRALPTAAEFAARKEEEWDSAALRSPKLTAEDFRPCPPTVRLAPPTQAQP